MTYLVLLAVYIAYNAFNGFMFLKLIYIKNPIQLQTRKPLALN